jgi:Ca2+-binding EF-hand superfamily protein
MMERRKIAVVVATLFALSAGYSVAADTAAPDDSKSVTQKAKDLFKSKFRKADKDNDGTVDREEAKALPEVAAHFDAIDTDKDGTVSRGEIKNFDKFAKSNKDTDDTLDKNEAKNWDAVAKNFEAIDIDKDGTVTLTEINAYMSAHETGSTSMK